MYKKNEKLVDIVRPPPPPHPFHKGGGVNFFKINGNGGEGLKMLARKEGVRQNGGVCLEMGGCHIILMCLSFLC